MKHEGNARRLNTRPAILLSVISDSYESDYE